MATAKNQLINRIDVASHRLGVDLKERGINRRILSLLANSTVWDITPDGDKVQIKCMDTKSPVPIWVQRLPVEDVIAVMEATVRRRGAEHTAQ